MPASNSERNEPNWTTAQQEQQVNPYAPPRSKLELKGGSGKLLPHQKAGRVIRLMAWLGVLGTVGIGSIVLFPLVSSGKPLPSEVLVIFVVAGVLTVAQFFVAGAVLRHATWGRFAGIAYGLVSLLGFPLGTIVGGYILWQLFFGWGEVDARA